MCTCTSFANVYLAPLVAALFVLQKGSSWGLSFFRFLGAEFFRFLGAESFSAKKAKNTKQKKQKRSPSSASASSGPWVFFVFPNSEALGF